MEKVFTQENNTIQGEEKLKLRLSELERQKVERITTVEIREIESKIEILTTTINELQESKDRTLSNMDHIDLRNGNDKKYEEQFDLQINKNASELKDLENKLQQLKLNSIPQGELINDDSYMNPELEVA